MAIEKICGKAVYFGTYSSDGPGYSGRLLLAISGSTADLLLPEIGDTLGNVLLHRIALDKALPSVVDVFPFEESDRQQVFAHVGAATAYYLDRPDYIEPWRCAKVRWSDGSVGAILLGGESRYASAIFFEGAHKGETNLSFELCTEAFATRDDLRASVAAPTGRIRDALAELEAPCRGYEHQVYGYMSAATWVRVQACESAGVVFVRPSDRGKDGMDDEWTCTFGANDIPPEGPFFGIAKASRVAAKAVGLVLAEAD